MRPRPLPRPLPRPRPPRPAGRGSLQAGKEQGSAHSGSAGLQSQANLQLWYGRQCNRSRR